MYALQLKVVCITLLVIASLSLNEAVATGSNRRRFGHGKTKLSSTDSTDKLSTDQVIATSTNVEAKKYRRDGEYSSDAVDYLYNTDNINLIHPENKPLHTKITAKYTSSITIPHESLEDSETAEEYVAKAIGMYGSRLREPIRVPYEQEPTPADQSQQHHLQQQKQQEHLQQKSQQHIEYHQQNDQQKESEEHKQTNYNYYAYNQKEVPDQQYTSEEKQSQQQLYQQYTSRPAAENETKQQLEEHLPTQEQMQQGQQLMKDREQEPSQPEQNNGNESPAPVYEKDPVTRSYNIYEEHTEGYEPSQQLVVDRNYHTKYIYKPISQYHENANENEERVRVSASTEIPKAEIMKQIEKSVIKYMKELEAKGKIIAAPQNQEPKTYFKVVNVPGTDEKRIASTTIKPTKYASSPSGGYYDPYKQLSSHTIPSNQKYYKNSNKPTYQTEGINTYQTPEHEVAEIAPNVEFIYKIRTKAPLHTATVKTVSKPYNLPIKSYDQFDHSSALKNLEEFDISHVVTTPDPEEHLSATSSKPNKLYFNSEIYHDINSLPFKQRQRAEAEFHQSKAAAEKHPDFKDYAASNSQSGYYAEPPADREASSSAVSEEGYSLMNPYQHGPKKEQQSSKYDDSNTSYEQQQPRSHKYKPQDYDSYSPKFNNNPEGYGYQQTYKTQTSKRHAPGKRGKRGGSAYPLIKDYEANVALRPPPKN